MDRTLVGDLKQLGALLFVEGAFQGDLAVDVVKFLGLRFAVRSNSNDPRLYILRIYLTSDCIYCTMSIDLLAN